MRNESSWMSTDSGTQSADSLILRVAIKCSQMSLWLLQCTLYLYTGAYISGDLTAHIPIHILIVQFVQLCLSEPAETPIDCLMCTQHWS